MSVSIILVIFKGKFNQYDVTVWNL